MPQKTRFKQALWIWGQKKKAHITYHVDYNGREVQGQVFIDAIDYVALGYGPDRRTALENASLDFLRYLVHKYYICKEELSVRCFQRLGVVDVLFPKLKQISLRRVPNRVDNTFQSCSSSVMFTSYYVNQSGFYTQY